METIWKYCKTVGAVSLRLRLLRQPTKQTLPIGVTGGYGIRPYEFEHPQPTDKSKLESSSRFRAFALLLYDFILILSSILIPYIYFFKKSYYTIFMSIPPKQILSGRKNKHEAI
jgi:hypothetical protein